MATAVNNDILRVVIHNINPSSSQRARNTLYYRVTNIVGSWSLLNIANAMSNTHAILYKPWQSVQTSYDGTAVARQQPNPTPEAFNAFGAGPGTAGGVTIPTQVTGLIRGAEDGFHQGSLTPKHPDGTLQAAEARLFISFPSTTHLDADATGRMSAGGLTVLQTIVQTLFATRTLLDTGKSCTLTPLVKSVFKNLLVTPPTSVTTFPNITLISASRRWATQKSRGDRGQREE